MKNKLRLLLCFLLICAIIPINFTFAELDRAGDRFQIEDIINKMSQTESLSDSELRDLLNRITPILSTPVPTPTPAPTPVPNGGPSPEGYTFCGNEDETCSFPGNASVAYGANGVYAFITTTTSTLCNNNVFGDPIGGTRKSCYYRSLLDTGL